MSRQTPLHGWHLAQGATMGHFGGYEMPLWYASAKAEHLCVLTAAGLFDTSHMATLRLAGPGGRALLQRAFTKDLDRCIGRRRTPLVAGRCAYGAFLHEDGTVIDDGIVYQLADEDYFIVVNAGMGPDVRRQLLALAGTEPLVLLDQTDKLGKIDLQGPEAARILAPLLLQPEVVLADLPYFAFKGMYDPEAPQAGEVRLKDGTPLLLSRTGYTGEFGFEIFVAPERLQPLWEQLLAAGAERGLLPCGLAARDSLRGGAMLPLSHQDIGDWPFIRHPWPFALPYADDGSGFTKDFVGAAALLAAEDAPTTQAFVGDDLRKVAPGEESRVLDSTGQDIGSVLTCITDMGLGRIDNRLVSLTSPDRPADFVPKGLCCGFVRLLRPLALGERITLTDGRRQLPATIVDDLRPDRTARRPLAEML